MHIYFIIYKITDTSITQALKDTKEINH